MIPNGHKIHHSKTFSYRTAAKVILSRWYWLALALIAGLAAGYFYLQFKQKLYVATGSLKIDDKRSELSELVSIRNIYDRTNKTESERFVLKSRNVIQKAISSSDIRISFFSSRNFPLEDIYPLKPLDIELISVPGKKRYPQKSVDFEFTPVSRKVFRLTWSDEIKRISKHFRYGDIFPASGLRLSIAAPPQILPGGKCLFRVNSEERLFKRIWSGLSIDDTQNTSIINLRLTDTNPFFARDVLNALIRQYQDFDRLQRTASIVQTKAFIGSLLSGMSSAVDSSGRAIQQFKKRTGLLNTSSALNSAYTTLYDLESQRHKLDIQGLMISEFNKRLQAPGRKENLNYGTEDVSDPQFNTLISGYNELIIRKKRLLDFYTPSAPAVLRTDDEINAHVLVIQEKIASKLKSNTAARLLLTSQIDSVGRCILSLPAAERELLSLQSGFDINQKVFNYLSEKQLEARIAAAAATSAAVIIDSAVLPAEASSPIPGNVYTVMTLASLAAGTAFIFLKRMLDPYIYSRQQVEACTTVPVVGIIRRCRTKSEGYRIPLSDHPRSLFAESVRSVRGGLDFLASEKTNKVICISSEVSGEGKSFVALNLAVCLTMADKRVLLISADLRRSGLHQYFNLSNASGLSQYLSSQNNLQDIVRHDVIPNLDFIASGPVPPNPSELLQNSKMRDLISELRSAYDFMILDSAPVGLVTDGKPLIRSADINLFILRSGVSKHHFALSPERLEKESGLSNFSILLNDYEEEYADPAYKEYSKEYFKA